MKKQFITIMICSSACMILAGCKGKSTENSDALKGKLEKIAETAEEEKETDPYGDKIEKTTEEPTEEPDEEPAETSEPEDPEKLYEPVFSEAFEVIDYGYNFDREYKYVSGGFTEKVMYSEGLDLLKDIGYVLEDLSGDGIPELMIGCDEDYGDEGPQSFILGIYTIKDDKPVTTVVGSPRSSYQYLGEGHFFYSGSGGAAITLFGENHLSKDGTEAEWDDFYFTDEKESGGIGLYYNNIGLFDANGSKELDMSEDEFFRIMNDYEERCEMIPWKPLASSSVRSDPADSPKASGGKDSGVESEPYAGVLYWYKEIQDSGKSSEDMEKYESKTELVQHGWPYATNNEEVRYVYEDLTGDGNDELIITYYNDPVDIYSNEGDAVYSYGVPYRALAAFYPDGTLMEGLTLGAKGWQETWYRYDDSTHKYVMVKGKLNPGMSEIILPEGKKIKDVSGGRD